MIRDFLETALQEELSEHIKSERVSQIQSRNQNQNDDDEYEDLSSYSNRRNGYSSKNIKIIIHKKYNFLFSSLLHNFLHLTKTNHCQNSLYSNITL